MFPSPIPSPTVTNYRPSNSTLPFPDIEPLSPEGGINDANSLAYSLYSQNVQSLAESFNQMVLESIKTHHDQVYTQSLSAQRLAENENTSSDCSPYCLICQYIRTFTNGGNLSVAEESHQSNDLGGQKGRLGLDCSGSGDNHEKRDRFSFNHDDDYSYDGVRISPRHSTSSHPIGKPYLSRMGTIMLHLKQDILIEIGADHSIRVSCDPHCTWVSINSNGRASTVFHPCGRVLQDGLVVNMETGSRLAKISKRGVTFASLKRSLIYLVDNSGCKTTTERFKRIYREHDSDVFYRDLFSMNSEMAHRRILNDLSKASYEVLEEGRRTGDEFWDIGGVRIKQKPWGEVKITKCYGGFSIVFSPTSGHIKVFTPMVKISIGFDEEVYFQVGINRCPNGSNDKKVTAGGGKFKAKNGSQQAGFDAKDQLVLF